MARVRDNRNVLLAQSILDSAGVELLQASVTLVVGLVLDGRLGTCHGRRWKGSGENEAGSERSDSVDKLGRAGNVAANAAVSFSECTSDDVYAILNSALGPACLVCFVVEMLSDTSAVWSVHAYSMDFVQKGNGTVLLSKVADFFDRSNGTAHAVHTLKGNDLGVLGRN